MTRAQTGQDAGAAALRATLRRRRRAITGEARLRAAEAVAARVAAQPWLQGGRRIGCYLALPEELDCAPLVRRARLRGCNVFLPRVVDYRHFRMAFFDGSRPLRRSRYGILEPQGSTRQSVRDLDVLFVPLVAFDGRGHRMGMGKGFYDRLLAFLRWRTRWRRPLLVGLAYDCQQVAALHSQPHDIPLDHVVTETTLHDFRRNRHP